VFILTFLASCATVIVVDRVRTGWRLQSMAERAAAERVAGA
jgi:hypothetical protein